MAPRDMNKSKTVCIVGGGMAGVKCAVDLTRSRVNVILLEARDRLGGRVHTQTIAGSRFDKVNHRVPLYHDDGLQAIYTRDGPVQDRKRLPRVAADLRALVALKYESARNLNRDNSLASDLSELSSKLVYAGEDDQALASQLCRSVELYHGLPWTGISAKYSEDHFYGRDAFVAGGYTSIFNLIKDQIISDRLDLRLNTVVSAITSTQDSVQVRTSRNAVIEADFVLVTVPLGVLKARTIQFHPQLPAHLTETIDRTAVAALGKFFFTFDEIFWNDKYDKFIVLGDPSEDPNSLSAFSAPTFVGNWHRAVGNKGLICLTAPPLTGHLETHPEMIWDHFKQVLEPLRLSKAKPIPKPRIIAATNWTTDPFALGSYSAIPPGLDFLNSVSNYAQGAGRVRFAGEHTILQGAGCVHGAYASGAREARFIINEFGSELV